MKAFPRGILWLFLVQFALFWQYAQREIVWAYPANFDQTSYLVADYSLYREALQNGLGPAVWSYLRQGHATGLMLPLQNCLLHFVAGPGRLSDLLLNFAYFALLETVVFATARFLTGRRAFGWLGCGLLLLQQSAFMGAGGIFDCRIDFIAYCLYGTFVCLAIQAEARRERRWLAAAALCGLLLVSFRFIAFSYLLGFCTTLLTLLCGLRLLRLGGPDTRASLAWALKRTAILGVGFLVAGGFLIAQNWHTVHDYYVVGHLTGNEKHVRAIEVGLTGLRSHLTYYAASLCHEQLGGAFIAVWLTVAALAVAGWCLRRWQRGPAPREFFDVRWLFPGLVVGASLFSPWFILTLDVAKSPIVANVLAVPVILLLFVLVAGLRPNSAPDDLGPRLASRRGDAFWPVVAAIVLALGAGNWTSHLTRAGYFSTRRASSEEIGAFYDTVAEQSRRFDLATPVLAVDGVYDWSGPDAIIAGAFERTGRWMNVRGALLGNTLFALSRAQIFDSMEGSDFVLLTTYPKVGAYPVNDSIRPLAAEMSAWCDAHLMQIRVFAINDGEVTLYARPGVSLVGLSGEWITPAGLHAMIPGEVLDWMRATGKKSLVMEGRENPRLPRQPVVSARPVGGGNLVCPADFSLPSPGVYRVRLDLSPILNALAAGVGGDVAVRFDGTFFVPHEVGPSADTRQLVETRPTVFRFE